MKKIKVFRFEVSNWAMNIPEVENISEEKMPFYDRKKLNEIVTENEIEETINDFIKDKIKVEIKVNTIDVNYHNNGRCNTVHMIYTIVYTDNK